MRRFNHLILPLLAGLAVCLLASCVPKSIAFNRSEILHPFFYQTVLEDAWRDGVHSGDTAALWGAIRSITIYKTAFADKYVESGSIMKIASLNDDTRRDTVDYWPPPRKYRQELYLVQVRPKDETLTNAWLYFSVWYHADKKLGGRPAPYDFSSAYRGIAIEAAPTINFGRTLSVKPQAGGRYQLRDADTALVFLVLDKMPADVLRINRLVVRERNKYGGPEPYVFNVAEHFRGDLTTIDFVRDTVIQFH